MFILNALFLVLSIFIGSNSFAFVENAVHGYPNCVACHVNPPGGGLLSDYGRVLSSELMSTIKTKSFQNPFYGLVHNTPTVKWGGQVRYLQTRSDNNSRKRGSSFLMQNNLEAAVYVKDFVMVGTVGTQEGPEGPFNPDKGEFVSERHYVLWNVDQMTRVKAGKFRQAYGLNDPNHTRFTKSALGFGSGSESYQLEVMRFFESGEAIIATSLGSIEKINKPASEKNVSAQATHYLGGRGRLTTNVLLGENSIRRRSLYGVNGIVPLGKHNLVRFDMTYQVSEAFATSGPRNPKTKSLYGNVLAGHRFFDGFLGYAVYEQAQSDLEFSRQTLTTAPGLGFQWLPIAHLELQFEHQYRTVYQTKENPEHRTFLTVHLYH
jgi:hypothetical protein